MPNGVFWTLPVAPAAVVATPTAGTARYRLTSLPVRDHHSVANALAGGPSESAFVTFDAVWSRPTKTFTVNDAANDFSGTFKEGTGQIAWSSTQNGFRFVSDPANTSTTVYAAVGTERNGSFHA